MTTRVRTMLLLAVTGLTAASAAGKSYMTLVGELIGAVEGPRLTRDSCAVHVPSTADENARLYEVWRMRHKDLLDAVAEQVARANVRLKKQGAPGGDETIKGLIETASQRIEQTMSAVTPDQAAEFCGHYSEYLERKDSEATTSMKDLLSLVEHVDKELTLRERT
jgi:hypothetical protein